MTSCGVLAFLAAGLAASSPYVALGSEVISDLADVVVTSHADEQRGLEAKAEEFWQGVLSAAEDMKMTEHLQLYARTEAVIAELPRDNEFVRATLGEALTHLQRADDMVLRQGLASAGIASEKLASPVGEAGWSFFSGGQNFLSLALNRFVAGGRFPERLADHIRQRQADVLPALRGAAGVSGSVLSDTRLASKLAFDVLKYDIYSKGVPRTPQAAKDLAYKLVDASSETRRRFTSFVTEAANAIARDTLGKHDSASAVAANLQLRTAEAQTRASSATMELVVNL